MHQPSGMQSDPEDPTLYDKLASSIANDLVGEAVA
jgi:hypothetical protein